MHPGSLTLVEMDPRVIFLRTNKIGSGPLAIALFHVMARGRGGELLYIDFYFSFPGHNSISCHGQGARGGYKIISYFDFSLSPPGHSSESFHGQGARVGGVR